MSKIKVIAFESNPEPGYGINWGAAAVEIDGKIFNGMSRLEARPESIEGYVDEGTLVRLPHPVEIPADFPKQPVVVAMITRREPISTLCAQLEEFADTVDEDDRWRFYIFADGARYGVGFDIVARQMVDFLQTEVLDEETRRYIIGAGLTLDHDNRQLLEMLGCKPWLIEAVIQKGR